MFLSFLRKPYIATRAAYLRMLGTILLQCAV